jgi:2-polyprenyl-6-hydroxyphenyl methylase/3-demethylubiquinone-9 3-methyltransferase
MVSWIGRFLFLMKRNSTMPFAFGKNWSNYLRQLDQQQIDAASDSLAKLLKLNDHSGKSFLDAGSGSGLFSLAAHRMGMIVTSFDIDPQSVECTQTLRAKFGQSHPEWRIEYGSLTDKSFMESLGNFDIVYCWGVAHHSGKMWEAIENLLPRVQPGGRIVLAIYNDQKHISRAWSIVKQLYQRLPRFLRPLFVAFIGAWLRLQRLAATFVACSLRVLTLRNPLVPVQNWFNEARARGMSSWYDLVDWVGGWPFEVATPEAIFRFARDRGFTLEELTTCQGHGCNEFVFVRQRPITAITKSLDVTDEANPAI